ncbi:hypothetical protein F3Y22_tig00110597pilonHSYRG01176 [Hibiscus syriacus]|uniref:Uncharacterized protein n=1 Tax=Hibiscus syriacus TaxID=106335 RepID=A0A6A3A3T7_HIBSY|nr:hypothetical protein F3Y22_tig00110597pilonHSYRG01176 [Hibiscus syriacus]
MATPSLDEFMNKASRKYPGFVFGYGHYPEWDEDHPIHFVGHSAGAQVVRVLQQMLANKEFKGYEKTSEHWVLSITSLSGAFNGTTRTYFDGMQHVPCWSNRLLQNEALALTGKY